MQVERNETSEALPQAAAGRRVLADDFDCSLCLRLLYEPVTLRCGHSFCGPCCGSLVKTHAKCPTCRRVLPIHGGGSDLATSLTLARLLRDVFPEEYERRRAEVAAELAPAAEGGGASADDDTVLPLFYLDPMLPHQRMRLNVFEPRYRLMVSRCLEGSRVFGMVGVSYGRGQVRLMRHGVEVEICENEVQPDGRLHIEVRATRRFEVTGETWQCDQYAVAHVRWLPACVTRSPPASAPVLDGTREVDGTREGERGRTSEGGSEAPAAVPSSAGQAGDPQPASAPGRQARQDEDETPELGNQDSRAREARLLEKAAALVPLVEEWQSLVESGGWQRFPGQLAKCLGDLGGMPSAPDAAGAVERALWVGALINPLPPLGVAPEIRPLLLESTDDEALVDIATEGLVQSIQYLTPGRTALWLQHHWRCLTCSITRRASPGPAPLAPDWLLLLNRLVPVLFIVSLLILTQSGGDETTKQPQDL